MRWIKRRVEWPRAAVGIKHSSLLDQSCRPVLVRYVSAWIHFYIVNAFSLSFNLPSSLFFSLPACLTISSASYSIPSFILSFSFLLSFPPSVLNVGCSSQRLQLSALGFDFLFERGSWRSCCHISNYPSPSPSPVFPALLHLHLFLGTAECKKMFKKRSTLYYYTLVNN